MRKGEEAREVRHGEGTMEEAREVRHGEGTMEEERRDHLQMELFPIPNLGMEGAVSGRPTGSYEDTRGHMWCTKVWGVRVSPGPTGRTHHPWEPAPGW